MLKLKREKVFTLKGKRFLLNIYYTFIKKNYINHTFIKIVFVFGAIISEKR